MVRIYGETWLKRAQAVDGAVLFDAWYRDLFGERWSSLRSALLEPVRHTSLEGKLLKPYFLDAGSLEAARALPLPPPGGKVLDMCAAPGGKTLALSLLFADMQGEPATLVANEYSRDRKARLISVLDEHLPDELRARVTVTGHDASRWSRYEQSAFDRILLDAPCSSERHVLSSPAYLSVWTPARVKSLALRQWSLLSGAWLVLSPGGYLVYSTCALSPKENDDVIGKLLKKYPDAKIRDSLNATMGEKTIYGTHILPDIADGSGPLYYAVIEKDA